MDLCDRFDSACSEKRFECADWDNDCTSAVARYDKGSVDKRFKYFAVVESLDGGPGRVADGDTSRYGLRSSYSWSAMLARSLSRAESPMDKLES